MEKSSLILGKELAEQGRRARDEKLLDNALILLEQSVAAFIHFINSEKSVSWEFSVV